MKQFFLTLVVLILVGTTVYAQQTGSQPTSAETRQNAQQSLSQSRTNSSQFESTLADLKARNTSNRDAIYYNQLMAEIERLENQINTEEGKARLSLDRGVKVDAALINRIEQLINQHKAKTDELEAFTSQTR